MMWSFIRLFKRSKKRLCKCYVLGEAKVTNPKTGLYCPYVVWYAPDRTEKPFMTGSGIEVGAGSGWFNAKELIKDEWKSHFQNAKCEWLVPHIKRIANGEKVSIEEIVSKYKSIEGNDPETIKIEVSG